MSADSDRGIVEGRLAPSVVKRLLGLGLEQAEIDTVVIPSRMVRILSAAEELYGDRERALAWLRTPNPRLHGPSPISHVNTDTGSRIVEELLTQIDEGMFI